MLLVDKYEHVNFGIVTTSSIKICVIRFLEDRISSITSDLHEEILKSTKRNTNLIIQIFPCKTALIQPCTEEFIKEKDLQRHSVVTEDIK